MMAEDEDERDDVIRCIGRYHSNQSSLGLSTVST